MKRTKRFGFVLTVEEKIAFKQLAQLEGLSKAALLRRLLRQEAIQRELWPSSSVLIEHWKNQSNGPSSEITSVKTDANHL